MNFVKLELKFHRLCFAVMFCFVGFATLTANEKGPDTLKAYIGPYLGYNLNLHFANFRQVHTECSSCNPVDYGTSLGSGFAFGGLFEYILYKDGKRTPMSIGVRLGYSDVSALFSTEEFIGNTVPPPPNDTRTEPAYSNHILDVNIQQINFAPYLAYYLTDALVGNVGLNFGYMMVGNHDQREELDRPGYATFLLEGGRVRNVFNGYDIENPNPLQFGILLGIGYEFPIFKYSKIMPELQYNFNFNKVSDKDWRTNSLRLGAAVKFALTKPEFIEPEIFYQRDTSIEYKRGITAPEIVLINTRREMRGIDTLIIESYVKYLPKVTDVSADLSYYAMVDGQKIANPTVVIEEFETTEYFPFLPIVYFRDGVADLGGTKQRQLTKEQLDNFDYRRAGNHDVFSLYYDMLNILAQRMHELPNTRINMTGYSSGVNEDAKNRDIARQRANAVKDYIVNLGINANRITVNPPGEVTRHSPTSPSYNDVIEESQRVHIFTADLDLVMPIVISDLEKTATPPEVVFEINANSEEGIKNYNLTLTQQTRLREFSNTANVEHLTTSETWKVLEQPIPMLEAPVNAVLTVTDNANQTNNASQNVTIKHVTVSQKKSFDSMDITIERYALCLFEFDRATSTPLHRKVLAETRNSIKPNSKLFISGYADRTGETQHNIDLARRRMDVVNEAINPGNRINAELNAVGNTVLIYDNNSPEGRAFSRTVRIEIHTPTK